MNIKNALPCMLCLLWLAGCTPPPPVAASQETLWKTFAHQPLDKLLLAWGAPSSETRLTTGARLLTYTHATTTNAASPYEQTYGCEVSFLAPPPEYKIENVAMRGEPYECGLLAKGRTGYTRDTYVPPPPPMYPYR